MKIDIESLIAAAVTLDREEEDVCRWELELETLAFHLDQASPAELARRGENLAVLRGHLGALAGECAHVRRAIGRPGEDELHPDVRPAVTRMASTAAAIEARTAALRHRLLDTALHLEEALLALHAESLEATLLRLFADAGAPLSETEMLARLADDRAAITAGMAQMRQFEGVPAGVWPRSPYGRGELASALAQLRADGQATRHIGASLRARWTLRADRRSARSAPARFFAPRAPSQTAPFWHASENVLNAL